MSQKIVVDPITRIEGHLRIEAQIADGQHPERLELLHRLSRHRNDPERARPARRPSLYPALLRRLHHRPLHGQHPLRRGRSRHQGAGQRPPDPQPDHGDPERAGPRHPLLPPARPRLGRHRQRPFRRSRAKRRSSRSPCPTGRTTAPATSKKFRSGSAPSPAPAASAPSRTPIGGTAPIACRRRRT